MKIADLIVRARLDVNDIDGERWEDAYIVDIINEAYCEVFNMRPDLFQKKVVAELDAGEQQQICCCSQIKSIDALTDVNGVKVADWREVDNSAVPAFGRKRCGSTSEYPTEYTLEPKTNRFTVSPPVKPGQKLFVRLTCSVSPKKYGYDTSEELDEFGCEYYGAVLDYVLMRLFGSETESATSTNRMQFHYRMFYEKLGLHDKVRERFGKKQEGKTA